MNPRKDGFSHCLAGRRTNGRPPSQYPPVEPAVPAGSCILNHRLRLWVSRAGSARWYLPEHARQTFQGRVKIKIIDLLAQQIRLGAEPGPQ